MDASDLPLGLRIGMPAAEYHAVRAMSAGGLKLMRQSPAHYYGEKLDPNRPSEPVDTPSQVNGTLTHCALFEPDTLDVRYVIKPEGMTFTTKEGKAWRDAQTRIIVTADQMSAARVQSERLRQVPELADLLAEGVGEASAFWMDDETGVLCKCRPDWTSPAGDGVVLVDGKTCQDASEEGFGRTIWNWRYYLQAAWYVDGYERATGKKVHGFVFAAVESSWPHQAAAYMLGDDVLDAARREYRSLLRTYAECLRTGQWPGYAPRITLINLPAWASRQLENLDHE